MWIDKKLLLCKSSMREKGLVCQDFLAQHMGGEPGFAWLYEEM